MAASTDTICAIATPPGEGGVGIVRVSGPAAISLLRSMYRSRSGRPRMSWPSHQMILGFVHDPDSGERIDEVLCVYMAGPRSFTGEDVVEVHAHGGPVPLRRIVDCALRLGARTPRPGEFTMRAFLNGRLDLAQAESVIDVIRARTDLSLRTALGQFEGKLSARVHAVSEQLLDWIAQLEATLDFPEDDIPSVSAARMGEMADAILSHLDRLMSRAEQGRILRDGVRVAIVGRPNVGKSSLLNALLGESRAIVTDVPGTTRDSIEEWLNVHGVPMRVMDTAGIRHSNDRVEAIGIERAQAALSQADLVLLVLDATDGPTDDDASIVQSCAARPHIVVWNKCDLPSAASALEGVRVSARTGDGLADLTRIMVARVNAGLAVNDELVGGNLRHRDALYRAREHVLCARDTALAGYAADFVTIDLKAAVDALGEITGAHVTDEVISRIFSQFCLGK